MAQTSILAPKSFSFIVCVISYKLTVQEYGMTFPRLKL